MALVVDYCGELVTVDPDAGLSIGRDADLCVDDNPFLHRRLLQVRYREPLWWLDNVGSAIAATVADDAGRVQAWLAPGAGLPVVFSRTSVRFSAGPTSYGVDLLLDDAPFAATAAHRGVDGETTIGALSLTPSQRALVVALAEPLLRHGKGVSAIPSSAQAAERLGWTQTRFNRKLDNVCQRLAATGVRGLHGAPGRLASNRRARLVEYAIAVRLVTVEDLPLLERSRAEGD